MGMVQQTAARYVENDKKTRINCYLTAQQWGNSWWLLFISNRCTIFKYKFS
jgi:hypothetical protein